MLIENNITVIHYTCDWRLLFRCHAMYSVVPQIWRYSPSSVNLFRLFSIASINCWHLADAFFFFLRALSHVTFQNRQQDTVMPRHYAQCPLWQSPLSSLFKNITIHDLSVQQIFNNCSMTTTQRLQSSSMLHSLCPNFCYNISVLQTMFLIFSSLISCRRCSLYTWVFYCSWMYFTSVLRTLFVKSIINRMRW